MDFVNIFVRKDKSLPISRGVWVSPFGAKLYLPFIFHNLDNRSSPRMKISFVIPVLNEQENILPLYDRLMAQINVLSADYEIIFVDDGSTDASLNLLKQLHARDSHVKLLSLSRNFGHQLALTAGMDVASGDACILMDADLQHPPDVIGELVARWKEGNEIVYTVRRSTAGAGLFKRGTQRMFYGIFRKLTGLDLVANSADFRLLDKKVLAAFQEIRERIRFLRGLTGWVGFRRTAVMFDAPARAAGETKYSPARMLGLAIDGLTSFTAAPLYVSIYMGAILTLLSFLYVPYVLYVRFVSQVALPGWASIITVLCLMGGLQLLILGVIGIYLAKIYEEVKHRPLYLVREAHGLPSAEPIALTR
jgi:polyisoprenyl-phosphate glycosyltransferase